MLHYDVNVPRPNSPYSTVYLLGLASTKVPLILKYEGVGWTNIECADSTVLELRARKNGSRAALPRYRPSWLVRRPMPTALSSLRA